MQPDLEMFSLIEFVYAEIGALIGSSTKSHWFLKTKVLRGIFKLKKLYRSFARNLTDLKVTYRGRCRYGNFIKGLLSLKN